MNQLLHYTLCLVLVVAIVATPVSSIAVNASQQSVLVRLLADWPVLGTYSNSVPLPWNETSLANACTAPFVTGITSCDEEGWVTGMQFVSVQLGVMSSHMSNMTHLNALGFVNNGFSGQLPSGWSQMGNLTDLAFAGNFGLNGTIPDGWSAFHNLSRFHLSDPPAVSGTLPAWIPSAWPKLETLIVRNTNIGGPIPQDLGNLSGLQYLDLSFNRLNGSLPSSLATLPALNILDLCCNMLTGAIPSNWSGAPSVSRIDISSNRLNGSLPTYFNRIETIFLSHNDFTGTIPQSLVDSPAMSTFAIHRNRISGPVIAPTSITSPLSSYIASDNYLTGPLPSNLWSYQNLLVVELNNNPIVSSLPPSVPAFPSCAIISLFFKNSSLNGNLPDFGACTNLRELEMSSNSLYGQIPQSLSFLTQLQTIDISDNHFQGPLPSNWTMATNLIKFLADNNQFNGTISETLLSSPLLQQLTLGGNQLDLCGNADINQTSFGPDILWCRVENQSPLECGCPDLWWPKCTQNPMALNCLAAPVVDSPSPLSPALTPSPIVNSSSPVTTPDSNPSSSVECHPYLDPKWFICDNGTWRGRPGSSSDPIIISGIVGTVVIDSSLNMTSDLVLVGTGATLIISGCLNASQGSSVKVQVDESDQKRLLQSKPTQVTLISQNGEGCNPLSSLPFELLPPRSSSSSCKRLHADSSRSTSSNFVVLFTTDASKCNLKYIIAGSVSGALLIIIIILIVVLDKTVPAFRYMTRPFSKPRRTREECDESVPDDLRSVKNPLFASNGRSGKNTLYESAKNK